MKVDENAKKDFSFAKKELNFKIKEDLSWRIKGNKLMKRDLDLEFNIKNLQNNDNKEIKPIKKILNQVLG